MTRKVKAGPKAPTTTARRRVAPTTTAGAPGYAVDYGFLRSVERDQDLLGRTKWETFSNLLVNVPIISAGWYYLLDLASRCSWSANPVSDKPEAKEWAEKLEMAIADMPIPMRRVVRRTMGFKLFGFSIQEWTAVKSVRRLPGNYTLLIEPRPQSTIERWDVEKKPGGGGGTVVGVWQRSLQTAEELYIPRTKIVYTVDDAVRDSPDGLGILRHCVEPARRLRRLEQLEGYGYESDLSGMPVARAPLQELHAAAKKENWSPNEVARRTQFLKDFIDNHIKTPRNGLLMDSATFRDEGPARSPGGTYKWGVELIQAAATSTQYINVAINREILNIAIILGVPGLLVGLQQTGSYANAKDKSSQLALCVEAALAELRQTYDRDIVDVIWLLNGWPEEYKPELQTEPVDRIAVETAVAGLEGINRAGLQPDDPAIDVIRARLDLPPAPEVDPELMGALDQPPPEDEEGEDGEQPKDGAEDAPDPTESDDGEADTSADDQDDDDDERTPAKKSKKKLGRAPRKPAKRKGKR